MQQAIRRRGGLEDESHPPGTRSARQRIGSEQIGNRWDEKAGHLSDDQHEGQRRQRAYARMRPQALRRWTPLHFLLNRLAQLRDRRRQSIQ